MSLFRSSTHRDIWIESHCAMGCHRHPNCRILERGLRNDRKPVEWERNTRKNVLMAETYKCKAYAKTPPAPPRLDIDIPMFDVQPVTEQDADHA